MENKLLKSLAENGWNLSEVVGYLDDTLGRGMSTQDLAAHIRRIFLLPQKTSTALALHYTEHCGD